jgi:hypothetical protein
MTRFAYLRDPLFLIACVGYAVNRLLLKHTLSGWFLHSYFNDLLLIPAALPVVLWLQRRVGWRAHDRAPTWSEMLGHLALWSLICEVVGPLWLKCGTGDPADVLAYAVGGVAACLWWKHGQRRASCAFNEL